MNWYHGAIMATIWFSRLYRREFHLDDDYGLLLFGNRRLRSAVANRACGMSSGSILQSYTQHYRIWSAAAQ